tara:strand:+ start:1070 stop:1477 length:408 start_codon:yes stop_codon:yes gene_type:complete
MASHHKPRTLIYACSGCSDVAQLANSVALRLDHAGEAEMSCIAGVGGGVPGLVRIARSGRPIVAIDGCQMHCASHCLSKAGVIPTVHVKLYENGLRKRRGQFYDEETIEESTAEVKGLIARLPVNASAQAEEPPE